MTKLIVTIIIIYHTFLRTIGKVIGLLTAGLWLGFNEGVGAVKDMYKYIEYRRRATLLANKQKKEKEDG
jgi:hypothetical protein